MRVGDVEYIRTVHLGPMAASNLSEVTQVAFAVGIKVRALLVRAQCTIDLAAAITASSYVGIENGNQVDGGVAPGVLIADNRVQCLFYERRTLVTSGFPVIQMPWETLWWRILMPDVSLHAVGIAAMDAEVTLHYRFVELTDDEIVEIAAQRSTG